MVKRKNKNKSNKSVQSYEKLENPQFLDHRLTSPSPTRKDMYFHEEKVPVKETKELLSENEEMSIQMKENDDPNDDQIEPHSVGANSGRTNASHIERSQKHLNITIKDKNENISLSQNQHDRFKSHDIHRISSDKCYQQKSSNNVSDKKDESFVAPKQKNSNRSKNGANSFGGPIRDNSSNRNQKGRSNIKEASVNCISPPNENSNINTIENRKSKETIPEKFNTKTMIKYPSNKNSRNNQLKIAHPNTSETLNGPQNDKICGLTTSEVLQFSNQNTTDNMEQRKYDNGNFLKPKQSNLRDGTLPKDAIAKTKGIQQTKFNVYAEEFFPTDKCYNQSGCSKKNEMKETVIPNSTNVENIKETTGDRQDIAESQNFIKGTITPNSTNAENLKETTGDRQHIEESQDFIKENESVGINEHISTSCETNSSTNEPVFNETPKHNVFGNESENFSNPYEFQYNGESAYVFPEYLTYENCFIIGCCFNSNCVRCKFSVLTWNYKGVTYFHVYPYSFYGGHSWHRLFNNRQRTNGSLCCPYCGSLNSVNENSRI